VVEVAVRDDDSAHRLTFPSPPPQCAPQKKSPADESRINQIQARLIPEDVKVQQRGAHLEQVIAESEWHGAKILCVLRGLCG
jgi:hypothetical protein